MKPQPLPFDAKFWVTDPDHCCRIQHELFKLGYRWRGENDPRKPEYEFRLANILAADRVSRNPNEKPNPAILMSMGDRADFDEIRSVELTLEELQQFVQDGIDPRIKNVNERHGWILLKTALPEKNRLLWFGDELTGQVQLGFYTSSGVFITLQGALPVAAHEHLRYQYTEQPPFEKKAGEEFA